MSIREAVDAIRRGEVVGVPTDTVYGLAVHPEHDAAIDRLFALKKRPRGRNLPIMVADPSDMPALGVEINEPARRLFEAFAPGPLTVAMGIRPGAAPPWLHGRVECAVRIPDFPLLLEILRRTGPLLVTSANLHDQATREDVDSILADLDGRPDAVIDGGVRRGVVSTLVNCNLPAPVIERHGAIPESEIMRVLYG